MPGGYTYVWEQDAFDALTRRTRASISFKVGLRRSDPIRFSIRALSTLSPPASGLLCEAYDLLLQ